jgi:tetratricopeptide (TPR) repeat protein
MGLALVALQKYEEALPWFDRALALDSKVDSKTATVWTEKGNVLMDLHRYPEAYECYQKALEIEPENLVALANQGIIRQNEGKYEQAVPLYERALGIDPERFEIWENRGLSLGELGKIEEGIASYGRALELSQDSIWGWNGKGYLLAKLGKRDEALPYFEKAIAVDKSQIVPWMNKAITLRELKRYHEAEEFLKRALEVVNDKKDEKEVLMQLGSLLGDSIGDHESALKVYRRVLDIRHEADVQASIAECLIQLGRYKESRKPLLNTQSNEEPWNCIIEYLLVVSYALEGDDTNSELFFKRFLSHFEQRNDGHGPLVGARDWDYRSLLNTIAQKSPDLRTRFLLSLSVDLQIGNIDPSKLAFFQPFPIIP